MPRSWTVFPHRPIEKLQENLWTAESDLPQGPLKRRMGIARLGSGQILAGIALLPGLRHVFACHGPVVSIDPSGALRRAAAVL